MPLPPSVEREELHLRTLEMRGYRRSDGLYDIEGHLTDVKTYDVQPPGRDFRTPAGTPIHDMWVRLVVDSDLVIADVAVAIDSGPFADCPSATASVDVLRGERIATGWTARVKGLRGPEACTHVVEMLVPLGTVAFQTIAPERFKRPDALDATGRPVRIDSCYAYSSNRSLVMKRWPAHYTGAKAGADTGE